MRTIQAASGRNLLPCIQSSRTLHLQIAIDAFEVSQNSLKLAEWRSYLWVHTVRRDSGAAHAQGRERWMQPRSSSSLARRWGAAAAAWLGGGERQQQLGSEAGRSNHRLSASGSGRLARAAQLGLPTERSVRQAARWRHMAGPGRQVQQPKASNPTQIWPKHQCQMPARTLEQTRKPEIPSTPNRSRDQILGINSNPNL